MMGSDQVMSESAKKEELREAGRRRLEEFRKKNGAKKTVPTSQPRTSNSNVTEKQASVHPPTPIDSQGSAYGVAGAITTSSGFPGNSGKEYGFTHISGSEIVPQGQVSLLLKQVVSDNDALDQECQKGLTYVHQPNHPMATFKTDIGDKKLEVATSTERRGGLQDGIDNNFYGEKDTSSTILPNSDVSAKTSAAMVYSEGSDTNLFHQYDKSESVYHNSDSPASNWELGPNRYGPSFKNYLNSDTYERKSTDAVGSLLNFSSQRAPEPLPEGLNTDSIPPVNGILSSAAAETYVRRSRPSFLDSLNIDRDSHASGRSFVENEKFTTSKLPSSDFTVSSRVKKPTTPASVEPFPTSLYSNTNSDYSSNGFMGHKMLENSVESKLEYNSQRHNDDFSALEQHIEDLTQEKFSLQRAMEASKALAESLASENSSLTESYNQQAGVMSQLKTEMEGLQMEIKARLVELEAIKAEFTNVHLECNAADERAKLLASEVINIEEKALRLRSNELKLERELENSNAEIASYRKKLSSLEKERRDLQQTIDALQEEKKLLQSKIRKASTSGISLDFNTGHAKKDASTSTNEMGNNSEQDSSSTQMHNDTDDLLSLLENTSATFEDGTMVIPPDQVQVIQNINLLISEIKLEKEEAIQALVNEVSTNAKLKDMNKELSYKLEVQTQRLELLTAQSMASENLPARQPTGSRIVRETVAYEDEGDEVVERVLGWIMKLFPGGPSKRRTSRL